MATMAKMTLFVSQTATGQTISIRTTGKRGQVALNTVSAEVVTPSQSPSPDAPTFWKDVLIKAATGF